MPKIKTKFAINYEQQGSGEPLILIPYLAADCACYAFQVPEFSKRFTCIAIDLRGTGESEDPAAEYSTETLADDVVDFMNAAGIDRAHIFGLSFGAGIGLWLGAKYPERVQSLSLHGAWTKTEPHLKTVIESWQTGAKALGSVQEMVISCILPWCLTPNLYATKPDYVQSLANFVRSRPVQPVESFLRQTRAVLSHDVEAQLSHIAARTQITLGHYDLVTPYSYAERIKRAVRDCEVSVFEDCSHGALYEKVDEFNQRVMAFLTGHRAATAA
jgi:pimeloyl-ACP methyl ester carboxylesterase